MNVSHQILQVVLPWCAAAPLATPRKTIMLYALANCFVYITIPRPLAVNTDSMADFPAFARRQDTAGFTFADQVGEWWAMFRHWCRRWWLWFKIHVKQRSLFLFALWLPTPVLWFFAAILCFAAARPPALLPLGPLTDGHRMAGTCQQTQCFDQFPIRFAQFMALAYVFYMANYTLIWFLGFRPVCTSAVAPLLRVL